MIWRQGLHVPYNVYEGDRPICQTHTAMDARRICAAMNHSDGADILEDILAAVQQQGDAVEIWNRALDALFASLPVNAFYSRAFLMEKLNDLKTADLLTMPVGPAIIPPGTVPPKPEPTNAPALSSHFLTESKPSDDLDGGVPFPRATPFPKPEDEFARGLAREQAQRHKERRGYLPDAPEDTKKWCQHPGCYGYDGHTGLHLDRQANPLAKQQAPSEPEPMPPDEAVPLREYCPHPACYADRGHDGPHLDIKRRQLTEEDAARLEQMGTNQFCNFTGCYAKPDHEGEHLDISGNPLAVQQQPLADADQDIPF